MAQELIALFESRPWQQVTKADLATASRVPSMLTQQESRLYHWLGKRFARDGGTIIDLGCFVGGSSARLASGVLASGHAATVHAYDRFTVDDRIKASVLYTKGIPEFDGNDMMPLARRLLSPFGSHVVLHRGDITTQDWTNGVIDVIAHDASKSRRSMDAQSEIFWPHIQAGTIIIQQDYLHTTQPWVPIQMEVWADHFEPLATVPGSTAVFLCTKTPTSRLLHQRRVFDLPHADQIKLIKQATQKMARFGPEVVRKLEIATCALEANPGVEQPWKLRAAGRAALQA